MTIARVLALTAAVLAARAHAQTERVTYSLSWRDIGGNNSGWLDPGESAQIVLSVSFAPPVGTQVPYTPPPPPGVGTVAGLGSIFFDLVGACGGDHTGQWTLSGPGFQGTTGTNFGVRSGWMLGPAGQPQPNGDVLGCGAGQFFPTTPNPANPVVEIWRARWTPNNFAAGSRVFRVRPAAVSGGQHSSLLLQVGPPSPVQFIHKYVEAQFSEIVIPIGQGLPVSCTCYANCDGSTTTPVLNVNDFVCFQTRFAGGEPYADCDHSGVLNVNDFVCFQGRFATGCP